MAADQAIVLAGGLGTRLRSVVADLPKALAPVAGRPFLAWLLDALEAGGVRHVVLATGYMAAAVERFAGPRWGAMAVDYSREDQPLGTGGAVRLAAGRLAPGEGVHVVNGDTFLRYAPQALQAATEAAGADAGVALARVDDVSRYGSVAIAGDRIEAFREKQGTGGGFINAGCYYLTPRALAALPDRENFSLERDVLEPMARSGALAAFTRTSGFIDIGVPEDFHRAQALFGAAP